jgi:hypothetical protein
VKAETVGGEREGDFTDYFNISKKIYSILFQMEPSILGVFFVFSMLIPS